MAQVKLDRTSIETWLSKIQRNLTEAVIWTRKQPEEILLDVPEPYEHLLPYSRNCNPRPGADDCPEIGVMMAVFARMKGARAKTKPRK